MDKIGDDYYSWTGIKIDPGEVGSETGDGRITYWQIYTPAQYQALQRIIQELESYGISINPSGAPYFKPEASEAIRGRNLWSNAIGEDGGNPLRGLSNEDYSRYKKYMIDDYSGGWVGHSAVSKKNCPGPYLIWAKIRAGITNES